MAIEELKFHGRANATKVVVLTGSGMDATAGTYTLLALAEEARQADIQVFPIATAVASKEITVRETVPAPPIRRPASWEPCR